MRLLRFTLDEAPGLPQGFRLEDLDHALVLVHGPNGAGKSTLCRAVGATLWPGGGGRMRAEAVWRLQGGDWHASLVRGDVRWQRAGLETGSPPPGLPDGLLAPCYLLSLRDLLPEQGATEQELAARLRREMAGGFDIQAVRNGFAGAVHAPRKEVQVLEDARRSLVENERRCKELAAAEDRLASLQQEIEELGRQARERDALEKVREILELRARRDRVEAELQAFPEGMETLDGGEGKRLAALERTIAESGPKIRAARQRIERAKEALRKTGLERSLDEEEQVRLANLERRLQDLHQEVRNRRGAREAALSRIRGSLAGLGVSDPGRLPTFRLEDMRRLDDLLAQAQKLAALEDGAGTGRGRGGAPPRWLLPALVVLVLVAGVAAVLGGWIALSAVFILAAILAWIGYRRRPGQALDLDARREELRAGYRELSADLGLPEDPQWSPGRFLVTDWADRLKTLRGARGELDDLDGKLARAEEELREALQEVRTALDLPAPPEDAGAAQERLQVYVRRSERHARAREDQVKAEQELEALEAGLQEAREAVATLYRDARIPEGAEQDRRAELARRLRRREAWLNLVTQRRETGASLDRAQATLGDRPDLLELRREDLEKRLEMAGRAEEERGAKQQELGALRQRLQAMQEGQVLEDALAKVEEAREKLHRRRDEALRTLAAAFLLERAEAEHEECSRPPAVRKADELLRRFTAGRYALVPPSRDGASFRARDTKSGRGLALGELSDGTRVQMLLAVRVGFLEAHEGGGEPLPLFLDEALGTSDPLRFRAVAEALLEIAADGRQVFYLTADPADVAAWQRLCCARDDVQPFLVDLAAARGLAGAWDPAADAPLPAPPPDPALPPEEFARRAGVPAPDPWQEPGALHLFHLLEDDLSLLHQLLHDGVRAVGPWLSLGEAARIRLAGSREAAGRVTARCRVAEVLWPLWRQGRAAPVDLEELRAAEGVLSENMLEKVAERLEEVGRSAERFLRDPRIPRFGPAKREAIVAWFQEQGYLPDGDVLTGSECIARVQDRLAIRPDAPDPTLAATLVARLLARLAGVRSGPALREGEPA